MSALLSIADKTIALSTNAKAAARFDSLSPLHHKSLFTIDQTMTRPGTRTQQMRRIFAGTASGRVQ
jgi:hypothetical protein